MPSPTSEITHESKISVIIKSRRTVAGLSFAKLEDRVDTNGQEAMESFWQSTDLALSRENMVIVLNSNIGTRYNVRRSTSHYYIETSPFTHRKYRLILHFMTVFMPGYSWRSLASTWTRSKTI